MSSKARFCAEIFDRGIRDIDLEFIHQTRDESPAALRDVLKNTPAFRSFSKDEINELVTFFRSSDVRDKDTDVVLKELTDNFVETRRYLQDRIQGRQRQQEEKPMHDSEPVIPRSFKPVRRGEADAKPLETEIVRSEVSIPREFVENYVTIGDFALAFKGPNLHRYMLLKPWEFSQLDVLLKALELKHISVVSTKDGKGILALIHPKDLGVLPRLVDTLKTVEPFKEDPSSF